METGDKRVDDKLAEWFKWNQNEKFNEEFLQLIKDKNIPELEKRLFNHMEFGTAGINVWEWVKDQNMPDLEKRLFNRMEFGTAGLRARMGDGYSMMNDLTVIQATQGLCKYVMSSIPEAQTMGVCVGFDGRHNSHRFAQLTANIFLQSGIPVYLFSKMCPTPYVAYCTRHYKCACGVMVTASHNPKEDNGYKVYWSNGAQIISPVDKGIAQCISENLEPWPASWEIDNIDTNPLLKDPFNDVHTKYHEDVKQLCYFRSENEKTPVKFTYTAMHGVGYPFTDKSVQQFGFQPVIPVKEQVEPDPDFPTVKYPNPEEGKGALTLSMKTADETGSSVILANDPDADRLALAEKSNGEWTIFTGNEIGALLGWWSWFAFRQKNPDFPASECCMLASTVSSKILQSIAKVEGFHFEDTLTGFKYMGNKSDEFLKQEKKVLFAFEEAIGFMCGSVVLDKDGVSAAAVCAEMATYVYQQGGNLKQQLENIYKQEAIGFMCGSVVLDKDGVSAAAVCAEMATYVYQQGGNLKQQLKNIYKQYGVHMSSNSYYICHDPPTITKMFEEIRNFNNTGKYPDACGPYKIKYIRDLTAGYDNAQPDNKPILPTSKSSQMITFTFENGCVATLRTSGTEPKIKYYTEHRPDPAKGMDRDATQKELEDMVSCIVKYFYQPEKFGFIARSS